MIALDPNRCGELSAGSGRQWLETNELRSPVGPVKVSARLLRQTDRLEMKAVRPLGLRGCPKWDKMAWPWVA